MTTELINAVDALNDVTQKHTQLNEKYQSTYDALANNTQAMTDWQTQQGTVELTDQHGHKYPMPTLKTLVEQAQSVNPHPHAMIKAQFDALRELRKQQYAGSGFVEWGATTNVPSRINPGIWSFRDSLFFGRHYTNGGIIYQDTKSHYPIIVVDGTSHKIDSINTVYTESKIDFPPAPDGTKTYDSATGTVTQHTNAEVAFAAETATNKVITSRKDLVFLESWHEKIADKDVVYPLGNVQFGASSYEGVTLHNNLVAQGYSAFGEWDENTKGYGVKWSSLTDAQKALFLSKPEHNIYFDPKANAYIQVRYRIRVVEGLGDDWHLTSPAGSSDMMSYHQSYARVKSRGSSTTFIDCGNAISDGFFGNTNTSRTTNDAGLWEPRGAWSASKSHDNKIFAVPIALVQRMNQGAYHPTYNPMGCNEWWVANTGSTGGWYDSRLSVQIVSTKQCFSDTESFVIGLPAGGQYKKGAISSARSGRSDQYKYYDAIYAGQVEDLRLNANKLDVNKLREDAMRKAVAGKMRGKGRVPFTFVMRLKQWTTQLVNQGWVCFVEPDLKTDFYTHPATKDIPRTGGLSGSGLQTIGSFKVDETVYTFDEVRLHPQDHRYIYFKLTAGTLANTAQETNAIFTLQDSYKSTSEFDSLPWVDIIGHPERIAATFPDGVVGQWVPQVPGGSALTFSANKKVANNQQVLFTLDDGDTWGVSSSIFGEIDNSFINSIESNRVQIMYYESHSNFTEPSTNSIVNGGVGDVYYTTHSYSVEGNRLQGSLTGGIGKATADPAQAFAPNLGGYKIVNGQFSGYSKYPVKTGEVPLAPQGNDSPAVKALSTITEKNGLYYLQLHGAELKHETKPVIEMSGDSTAPKSDFNVYKVTSGPLQGKLLQRSIQPETNVAFNSTDWVYDQKGLKYGSNPGYSFWFLDSDLHWGDDQTIPIIDGENIKTDLNGNTVKVFCHHTQIPLGIAHND